MIKLQLLLGCAADTDLTALTRALYDQTSWVADNPTGTVKLAVRDDRARAIAPALDVPELDVVLELGLPDDAGADVLVDRVATLHPVLAGVADPSRSIAIVGREHVLVTGDGPFQLFRAFGRRSDISLRQFTDHFLNIHSQFGVDQPGRLPYRQLHRDERATARLRELTGFVEREIDGVAQLFFYGADAVRGLYGNPERGAAAAADGALFIDPDTRRASIATIVLNAGPLT